jgi:ABC-type sugar transport system ATPase subunit
MLSQLLHTIRRLAALQIACLYLTRRLSEALDIGDRVTILRDGQVAGVFHRDAFDEVAMTRAMISQRPGDIPHYDEDEQMERRGLGALLRRWRV